VYWLSKNLRDGSIHVHHSAQEPVNIGPASESDRTFTCPAISANVQNYVYARDRYVSGAKFYGWLVLVTRDGQVIASRGSSSEQQMLSRDRATISRLISEATAQSSSP
jgi:hypothetical protein